jgi:hypothetical protein
MSFILLLSACNKDSGPDPSPPPPETPDTSQTSAIPVIKQLTYRHIDSNDVIEEVYSFTYDTDGRITGCDRADKNMPHAKFTYAGNELSSVTMYTSIGTIAVTYVANQTLFVGQDSISFYYLFKLFPENPYDTAFQAYYFRDSALQKGTVRYGSTNVDMRSTYDNYICEYDDNQNLLELGFVNTSGQYIKHMDIVATDDKINPVRYASRIAFLFVISYIDVELITSMNNFTSLRYADGRTADYEYTYNEKGWPLTVRTKGQNFIKFEYEYGP